MEVNIALDSVNIYLQSSDSLSDNESEHAYDKIFYICRCFCLRHILHISWQDRVTNNEILKYAGIPSLFTILSRYGMWGAPCMKVQDVWLSLGSEVWLLLLTQVLPQVVEQ